MRPSLRRAAGRVPYPTRLPFLHGARCRWVPSVPQVGATRAIGPFHASAYARQTGPVIRVFLLDDHEVVRRGLRELLESEGDIEVVGESGSAQEATARIPALRPN